ncbi:uncharacterized protein FIBRA_00220 [Fibroporia radiculosa]|uniref:XPG-I domain-containing protein n=1 Tax=Fibroporia radiculosa TaxID=599839 RepID=J7SBY2_9APHY|nr:uncharacterized protein FIBRA_00220 [Fibroporia radiculosa]CCL98226.1 predicted protein [Fibroporia radiculosa]
MHRVRLLQHYRIKPYIVFDGGPLPAKQGTESDRKKRRDENLARANALAAQGKHGQAREYYVKCIDVTPQMAYQLIKALRAESVPYVVAPYEADAQLAYLERIGIVDGIITEDSDLLVFGCKKVLFKLDPTSATIICVSRADFASVTSGSSGGISLLGWSDVQFRSMAILSGCDYLPSIQGIGLKTAHSLLRKYKTVENVIRALNLEGKKKVPSNYLQAFRKAEKVFLYQRVYDPTQEMLVYLSDPPAGELWDEETEAYVGTNLEASLAKQVAEGDACPISLLPMEDINPTFVPRVLKPIPKNMPILSRSEKDIVPEKPTIGILSFFTPKSKIAPAPQSGLRAVPVAGKHTAAAGRASGKRTLTEVMDQDMAAKRKRREETHREVRSIGLTSSKFFCAASSSPPRDSQGSRMHSSATPPDFTPTEANKENIPSVVEDDILMPEPDSVSQEDGYVSPSPSMARCNTPELCSPLVYKSARWTDQDEEDDFGADVLSSPPARRPLPSLFTRVASGESSMTDMAVGKRLVRTTLSQPGHDREVIEEGNDLGPDLRDTFGEWDWDEVTSDIECLDASGQSACSGRSSPGPVTPDDSGEYGAAAIRKDQTVDAESEDGVDVMDSQAMAALNRKVANGWWERWARGDATTPAGRWKQTPLKRRETTMTADGRQRPVLQRPHSAQPASKGKSSQQQEVRSAGRRSLVFTEDVKKPSKGGQVRDTSCVRPGTTGSLHARGDVAETKNKFAEYR